VRAPLPPRPAGLFLMIKLTTQTTQFSALRGHLILYTRAPMKVTAFNALWQIATLCCTRKAAKWTALRTVVGAVMGVATRAGDSIYCQSHGWDNRRNSHRANEDRTYAHLDISKQNLVGPILRSRGERDRLSLIIKGSTVSAYVLVAWRSPMPSARTQNVGHLLLLRNFRKFLRLLCGQV
jgi:hypothetical protein